MKFPPRVGSGQYVGSDHYYVFTTRLTAQGLQRTTMLTVAVFTAGLSLPAVLAMFNPKSTYLPGGRAILVVVALLCWVFAAPWLRHRWPTRAQSTTLMATGAVALAVGCVIAADPLAGLLIGVAFPFILGYAALFHSTALLAFTVAVAASTYLWLARRIAAIDLPTAFAVTTPLVFLTIVVVFACRTIARLGGAEDTPTDVDTLTGLLTRASFHEAAAHLIGARNRGDDQFLVVAVVAIDSYAAIISVHGGRGANRAQVSAAQALRDTVRRDCVVGHVDESEFLIADVFTAPDPAPLIDRILGAVASTQGGMTASVGVLSTPLRGLSARPPVLVIDEAIALATTAMHEARRSGGNQARYVSDSDLAGPE
jgi:GGDEF domain-containing protein